MLAIPIQSVDAAPAKFKNCTELNKTYPGGVAKDSKVKNKGGKTKHKPFVSAEIYKSHIKMDRDKDGIACEK
ncbi:excalibur calcium-binding domain-containing protein [Sporosarcina sp. ACRSL]|uniref:excalibur calcium-binding domain-containing protein n=1 Tax=Sporosarcina sp. ACRSL TaxID=2918215 RepID=UPI001EF50037|nr:excalibur calcium-binding domain-containing protein [Sporosarcina sp. ACRSL]MCG7346438.1 excalibur calcium-binding domain-containing protein [Sporosarcina sp. ACRSL]